MKKFSQVISKATQGLAVDSAAFPKGKVTLRSWEVSTEHGRLKAALYWSPTGSEEDPGLVKVDEVFVVAGATVVRQLPRESRPNVFDSAGGGKGKLVIRHFVLDGNDSPKNNRIVWEAVVE